MKDQESMLKECSHHPKVNQISEMIVEYKRKDTNLKKVENFLLNYIDSRNENLNKAKKESLQQEMKECSFKPKINNFLSEKKQKPGNVYDNLYNEYKTYELKKSALQATLPENMTFHPKINKTNKMAEDFDFFQRLQIFEEMKKQRLNA